MAERLRFHLNEGVNPDVGAALRRVGIDVSTSQEMGLLGRDDSQQLRLAREQARVLVTHDTDFLRIARRERDHPGIVYCPMHSCSLGQLIRNLILVWEVLSPADMSGRVEFL